MVEKSAILAYSYHFYSVDAEPNPDEVTGPPPVPPPPTPPQNPPQPTSLITMQGPLIGIQHPPNIFAPSPSPAGQ